MDTMPYDNGLEDILLGSLIIDPKGFENVEQYISDGDVFDQTKSQRLWKLLSRLRKSNEAIDLIVVSSHLTPDDHKFGLTPYYLTGITSNACSGMMAIVYAKRMYEKYLLRKVVGVVHDIKELASNNNTEVFETLNQAHTVIGQLIEIRPDEKFDIDKEVIDAVNDIKSKENKLIKTGYKSLDKLSGGLTRGEITIIGGRPGHGKSTFAINLMSKFISQGKKVVLFNRELTNTEVLKKIIALESGRLSYNSIRNGIYGEHEIKILEEAKKKIVEKYNEGKFKMFDNIRDLPRTINEIRKFKPDVVIDDYIQLVRLSDTKEVITERRLQLERIVSDYKWVAKEVNCSVVLASQLNRALETRGNQRPQLSDLAESGAIEQVAENVFFVFYPYKMTQKVDEKFDIFIKAAKVRYGETGEAKLGFNGDKVRMYESWLECEEDMRYDKEEKETLF